MSSWRNTIFVFVIDISTICSLGAMAGLIVASKISPHDLHSGLAAALDQQHWTDSTLSAALGGLHWATTNREPTKLTATDNGNSSHVCRQNPAARNVPRQHKTESQHPLHGVWQQHGSCQPQCRQSTSPQRSTWSACSTDSCSLSSRSCILQPSGVLQRHR